MEKGFKEQKEILVRGTEEILPPAEFDSLLKRDGFALLCCNIKSRNLI